MKRSLLFAFATLLVSASAFAPVSGGDKQTEASALDTPYYPLRVGSTWEYVSGGKKIIVKVAAHETLDGVNCARIETEAGPGKVTEHLTVKADGIYRVRANNEVIKPPLLIFKLPATKGESWTVDSVMQNMAIKGKLSEGEEKITAGKTQYDAISVKSSDMSIASQSVSMENWYAKDVGMVKQHFKLPSADLDVVLELEKFTAGK